MFLHAVHKMVVLHQDGSLGRIARANVAEHPGDMIKYVHFVGKLVGMAKDTRSDVWNTYKNEESVLVNESLRGRASPSYVVDDARKLKPEHLAEVESFIAECHGPNGGGRVTLQSIQGHLLRTFSPTQQVWKSTRE